MRNACKSLILLSFLTALLGGTTVAEAKVCFVVGGCGGDANGNTKEVQDCKSLNFVEKQNNEHLIQIDKCVSGGKEYYKYKCDTSYYNLDLGKGKTAQPLMKDYLGRQPIRILRPRELAMSVDKRAASLIEKYDFSFCKDLDGTNGQHARAVCKAKYGYGLYNEDGIALNRCTGRMDNIYAAFAVTLLYPDSDNALDVDAADSCVMLSGEHIGDKRYNGCVCSKNFKYEVTGPDMSGGYAAGGYCKDTFNGVYAKEIRCPGSYMTEPVCMETENRRHDVVALADPVMAPGITEAANPPVCGECNVRCKATYSAREDCVAAMKDNLAGNILAICKPENNTDCSDYYNLITPEGKVCPLPLNVIQSSENTVKNLFAGAADLFKAVFGVNDAMAGNTATLTVAKMNNEPVLANAYAIQGEAIVNKASKCATFKGQCYDTKTGKSTPCSGGVNCPTLYIGTKGAAEIMDRVDKQSDLSKIFKEELTKVDNDYMKGDKIRFEYEPNVEIVKSLFMNDCGLRTALMEDAKVQLKFGSVVAANTNVTVDKTKLERLYERIDAGAKLSLADFSEVVSTKKIEDLFQRPALQNFDYVTQITKKPYVAIDVAEMRRKDGLIFCDDGGYRQRLMCELANGLAVKKVNVVDLDYVKETNIEPVSLIHDKAIYASDKFDDKFKSAFTKEYVQQADITRVPTSAIAQLSLTNIAAINGDRALMADVAGVALDDAKVGALTAKDSRFGVVSDLKVYNKQYDLNTAISQEDRTKSVNVLNSLRTFNSKLADQLKLTDRITTPFKNDFQKIDDVPVATVTQDTYECVQDNSSQCWYLQKVVECTPQELGDGSLFCKECEDKCTLHEGYYDGKSSCESGVADGWKCVVENDTDKVNGLTSCYKRVAKTCSDYSEGGYKLQAAGCAFANTTVYSKKLGDEYGNCYKSDELVEGYDPENGNGDENEFVGLCGKLGGVPTFQYGTISNPTAVIFDKNSTFGNIHKFQNLATGYACLKKDFADIANHTMIDSGRSFNDKFGLFVKTDDMPNLYSMNSDVISGRIGNYVTATENLHVLSLFSENRFASLMANRGAEKNALALGKAVESMNTLMSYEDGDDDPTNNPILQEGNENLYNRYLQDVEVARDAKDFVTFAAVTDGGEASSLGSTAVSTIFHDVVAPETTAKSLLKGTYQLISHPGPAGAPGRAPRRSPGSGGDDSSTPSVDWDDLWE